MNLGQNQTGWYSDYGFHMYWWIDNWKLYMKLKGINQDFFCWILLQMFYIYGENLFSLWDEAWNTLYSAIANHSMVIGYPYNNGEDLFLDRIFAGSAKQRYYSGSGIYLNFFVTRIYQQRSLCPPTLSTEEIVQMLVILIPKPITPSSKQIPIGLWGSMKWFQHLAKTWFINQWWNQN